MNKHLSSICFISVQFSLVRFSSIQFSSVQFVVISIQNRVFWVVLLSVPISWSSPWLMVVLSVPALELREEDS